MIEIIGLVLGIIAVGLAMGALAWWINVGSARRHARQAHREAEAYMRRKYGPDWRGGRAP